MNNDKIEILLDENFGSINENDIPDIISLSINNIANLEKQVINAEKTAKEAMEYVDSQMIRYKEEGKWIFKFRSGDTKDIIEDTQKAVEKIASAQQVSVEALIKSFSFQKSLADTSKYLFDLGCSNITLNRIAIQSIKDKLSGASKETLSELAKKELLSLVKQLKEQEDIFNKQVFLNSKIIELSSRFDAKEDLDNDQSKRIDSLDLLHKEHNNEILKISESLSNKNRIDDEQNERIYELFSLFERKNIEDNNQNSSIADHTALIEKNSESIQLLIEYTKQIDALNEKQFCEIALLESKFKKKITILITLSSITIIFSIISIILFMACK